MYELVFWSTFGPGCILYRLWLDKLSHNVICSTIAIGHCAFRHGVRWFWWYVSSCWSFFPLVSPLSSPLLRFLSFCFCFACLSRFASGTFVI
ncbi:hypothetical protein JAAARDRAFT_402593 [Jaapia argillacea MUCL 33604]|uniref:Uncharacterized protein n=1 Tax=Jaapia argillacea MUCL 33604 TaxID=933084 RepID=A0A067PH30_9AGAM|nr:hypothetical protein JAAARDRAFT_402593 [Jaapia argillacea MUCL 33604]